MQHRKLSHIYIQLVPCGAATLLESSRLFPYSTMEQWVPLYILLSAPSYCNFWIRNARSMAPEEICVRGKFNIDGSGVLGGSENKDKTIEAPMY